MGKDSIFKRNTRGEKKCKHFCFWCKYKKMCYYYNYKNQYGEE